MKKPIIFELPNNGFAPSNSDISKHLRELADWIEEDGYKAMNNIVIVLEYSDGTIERRVCGQPIDIARMVGLLNIAAARAAVEGVEE